VNFLVEILLSYNQKMEGQRENGEMKVNELREKLEKKEKRKSSLCRRISSIQIVFYSVFSVVVLHPVKPKIFTINSLGDAGDFNPGDGVCETGPRNGICTPRAATQEAEALLVTRTLNLPLNQHNLLQIHHIPRRFRTTKDSIITNGAAVTAFPPVYGTLLEEPAQGKARRYVSLQLKRGPPSI
jgi:hypothetical protein